MFQILEKNFNNTVIFLENYRVFQNNWYVILIDSELKFALDLKFFIGLAKLTFYLSKNNYEE